MKQDSPHNAAIVSKLANDPDMAEIVKLFVDELPGRVEAIENSLTRQDFDALVRLAHQLKGAAGGYGFPQITDAARTLEESAQATKDLDRLATEVRELGDLCQRARAAAPQD